MSFQAGGELLPVRVAKVPAERDLSVDDSEVEGDSDGDVVRAVAWERGAFDEAVGESFRCKDEVERRPGVVRGRVERESPFLHKLTEIIVIGVSVLSFLPLVSYFCPVPIAV
jgi:hypothetical protein